MRNSFTGHYRQETMSNSQNEHLLKNAKGLLLTGLENPRPAVQKAGKFRMNMEDLPFDPKDLLKHDLPYDPSMENWGSGEN